MSVRNESSHNFQLAEDPSSGGDTAPGKVLSGRVVEAGNVIPATAEGEENIELARGDTLETVQHEIESAIATKN